MNIKFGLALIVTLALLGCGNQRPSRDVLITDDEVFHPRGGQPDEVRRPELKDGIFPVAEVKITKAPAPQWRSAGLPPTLAEFAGSWNSYPPWVYVEKRLCQGDPAMLQKLETAVESALAAGATDSEIKASYGELIRWCGSQGPCAWALENSTQTSASSPVAWLVLRSCDGNEIEAVFSRADAPDVDVIEYWSEWRWRHYGESVPYSSRLEDAVAAIDTSWESMDARGASFVLAATQDPRAADVLLDLHRRLPPGKLRDAIVPGMSDLDDPRLAATVAEYCAKPDQRDPICRDHQDMDLSDPTNGPDEPDRKEDCLSEPGLRSLIADGDWRVSSKVERCLWDLAGHDRGSASRQGEIVVSWKPAEPGLATTALTLARYPKHEDLIRRLIDLGLLPDGVPPQRESDNSVTAIDVLGSAGRILWFDVETGMYPNHHDGLLFDFVAVAGPPLSETLFEEIPPVLDLGNGRYVVDGMELAHLPDDRVIGEPYRLRAYSGGRVFEVDAQDFGDWYDLDQCLGLFNAIARCTDVELRAIALPTGDQTAQVLIGPRDAITAALAEGLIAFGEAAAAMKSGKAFEDRAFEEMIEE